MQATVAAGFLARLSPVLAPVAAAAAAFAS